METLQENMTTFMGFTQTGQLNQLYREYEIGHMAHPILHENHFLVIEKKFNFRTFRTFYLFYIKMLNLYIVSSSFFFFFFSYLGSSISILE